MIISRTPFRVSLLGGGTDFRSFYTKGGGLTLGGAIDRWSYITARRLPPFHDHKTRVVYNHIESVKENIDIQHRSIRATLDYLELQDEGLEIFHASDLPGRSGTGSSSTFVVGLVNALTALQGKLLSPRELAQIATEIEQERLGEAVGCQDQSWASHGGFGVIKFKPSGAVDFYPLALSHQHLEELESHLLLFFTRVPRTSSDIVSQYKLEEHESSLWAMVRLAEQGIEAIQDGNYEKLGTLIDRAWRIKCGLADGVTTEQLSRLYNLARLHGAFGGKLTGAGGGGCLLLVAPPEKQASISAAMAEAGCLHIPFHFEHDGSRIIYAERS